MKKVFSFILLIILFLIHWININLTFAQNDNEEAAKILDELDKSLDEELYWDETKNLKEIKFDEWEENINNVSNKSSNLKDAISNLPYLWTLAIKKWAELITYWNCILDDKDYWNYIIYKIASTCKPWKWLTSNWAVWTIWKYSMINSNSDLY